MTQNKVIDKKLKISAEAKLKAYKKEQLLRKVWLGISSILVFSVFTIIFGMTVGGKFNGILGFLGLPTFNNELTGIYTDCSLTKNRDQRYCQKLFTKAADVEWKNLTINSKGGSKFRLSSPTE
jgi:hypothetical protein